MCTCMHKTYTYTRNWAQKYSCNRPLPRRCLPIIRNTGDTVWLMAQAPNNMRRNRVWIFFPSFSHSLFFPSPEVQGVYQHYEGLLPLLRRTH